MSQESPKDLTWDEYLHLEDPVDRARIEWWEISVFEDRVERRTATFYVYLPWEDHPWSEGRPGRGADFRHEWALEDGRGVGWGFIENRLLNGPAKVFETESEALSALSQLLKSEIRSTEERLASLRAYARSVGTRLVKVASEASE